MIDLALRPTLLTAPTADSAGATPKPTLIVGPSLGTGVAALWQSTAVRLAERFTVIGWDLPGHAGAEPSTADFTMEELAVAVLALVDRLRGEGSVPAAGEAPLFYAGVSIGGAVGAQLGHDAPDAFDALSIICSAATIGTPEAWRERAALVAAAGTPTMVTGSAERWFVPGFLEQNPEAGTALLHVLQNADRHAYAHACAALAGYDLTGSLGSITAPVLAIAGAHDAVCPPADAETLASGVANGRAAVVPSAAHLAPVEDPAAVAELLTDFFLSGAVSAETSTESARLPGDPYDAGMGVRRQVLGDAHVDRANANIDPFTADFQEMITRYAWGTIWTRGGLDRVTRSAVTLTAMIAGSYWEELEMHVHAALRNGMTEEQLKEIFLQAAIYCSVPAANVAFKIGQRVLAEYREDGSGVGEA
ncbi:bifunctional 3-oxoadipate enol-lactonase/4-carboxymuconolactone decarboxylase PcaDC [Zhihengliuella flava]|uniref:3-oxoadipate enol-lactonase/4-carboxymuconolactone decarboxylase n=1 Tax=Zhihengliuella flava TaxID=1285193 RepID=A0A931GEE5_9MICC|nr:3-oxoadipate enol-lactonase/4-carboxymuconolactone decarboxylase [Zhihengliuella flava]